MPLSKRQSKLLTQARTRHGRRKSGLTICEGARCCREALLYCPDAIELLIMSEAFQGAAGQEAVRQLPALGMTPVIVPDSEFPHLTATENPQGVLCLIRRPAGRLPSDSPATADPFVLIVDQVADPGNLGTILRTAWAVGLQQVWLTSGSTDAFSPKAIRAGMGAQFALDIRMLADLQAARSEAAAVGLRRLWCAVPRGGVSCFSDSFELPGCGLVIGNEARGIDDQVLDLGDRVSIPMPGATESLNVAQAATILLFEGVRRGVLSGRESGA